MRKPLLLLPVVALFGLSVSFSTASLAQEGKGSTEVSAHVKKIFEVDCALCHGATGDGKTDLAHDMGLNLSDLSDPATLQNKSDQQLFDLIRKGKDKMPSEDEGRAKDAEVRSLIVYIRSLSKGHTSPAPGGTPAATPSPAPATPTAPGSN